MGAGGLSTFPLLQLYDDSLHNRWRATGIGDVAIELDSPDGNSQIRGRAVPCSQSMQVAFNMSHQMLALRTEEAVQYPSATSLLLTFVFSYPGAKLCIADDRPPTRGTCTAAACVALRSRGMSDADTRFVPLCASSMAATSSPTMTSERRRRRLRRSDDAKGGSAKGGSAKGGSATPSTASWSMGSGSSSSTGRTTWWQASVPLALLVETAEAFDEVLFVRGPSPQVTSPFVLKLDDVWIAATQPPSAGDRPPSYGRSDLNPVRSSWLQGVRQGGAASGARARGNDHLCEYMTSEVGHSGGKRPLCRMDGDHLEGRWLQTCDPRTIGRPDHFAYGRALTGVSGWYDYRLCYRQSATERMRALQALSWSWRPKGCALQPVDGAAFDRWLGQRTLVLVGDSLQAQTYYSLLWLLGDAVLDHKDINGLAPEDRKGGIAHSERVMGKCVSTVGNEGGWLSIASLRSGGRLVKVLRHAVLVDELLGLGESTFWAQYVRSADFVLLNVGHHYHGVDKSFQKYGRLARQAAINLERLMKPSAQLVFRTTNIGHYACENASRPLHSRLEAWEQLTTSASDVWAWHPPKGRVDIFKDKYNWRGPPLFEHEWADAAQRTQTLGPRFSFLNVSFMDSRADGHVATSMRYSPSTGEYSGPTKTHFPLDCLHYCFPGPTDYWALSVYNLMLNNPRFS